MAERAKRTPRKKTSPAKKAAEKKIQIVEIPEYTTQKLIHILVNQPVTTEILNLFADAVGVDLAGKQFELVGKLFLKEKESQEGQAVNQEQSE